MNYWHQYAEAVRAQLGYSGGTEGNEFIPLESGVSDTEWSRALERAKILGYVSAADAETLGLPAGTPYSTAAGTGAAGSSTAGSSTAAANWQENAYASGDPETWIMLHAKELGYTTADERASLLKTYKNWAADKEESDAASKAAEIKFDRLTSKAKEFVTGIPDNFTWESLTTRLNAAVTAGQLTKAEAQNVMNYLVGK
jgi:hypothetical protein